MRAATRQTTVHFIHDSEDAMHNATVGKSFRVFSFVVLALMAAAIVYAAGIALQYWSGISV